MGVPHISVPSSELADSLLREGPLSKLVRESSGPLVVPVPDSIGLCCVLDSLLSTRLVAAATGESLGAMESLRDSDGWPLTVLPSAAGSVEVFDALCEECAKAEDWDFGFLEEDWSLDFSLGGARLEDGDLDLSLLGRLELGFLVDESLDFSTLRR